jgi:PAS domain S-box-containing protein
MPSTNPSSPPHPAADAEVASKLRLLATAVERLNDIVLITEAEPVGAPGPRIVFVNDAFERRTGYTRDEAIGQTPRILQGPNTQRDQLDRIRAALEKWEPVRAELINYTKAGEEFWLELDIVPVADEKGWYTHWIAIERDVTERKLAEAAREAMELQLRELQKMEAIGTLAGGIAHDFNNIIATMLGNAELARRDLHSHEAAMLCVDEIVKAGRRARDLVRQILTFSRRQAVEMRPTPVVPIVRDVEGMLRANLPAKIALDVHVSGTDPVIRADATQMMQVLMNLGTNAIQAMRPHGGTLHFGVETVLSSALGAVDPVGGASQPCPAARLIVRDTGPGMEQAVLDRMFEPFFTTKPPGEGTGLGLSVVHGIVQSHGGLISVWSKPGRGTCFTVDLPLADKLPVAGATAPPTDIARPAPRSALGAGKRILYLDDDDSLVFLVRRLLQRDGFSVATFSIQAEAIAAVKADPTAYDLIVTDFNMPGMNGLEVVQELLSFNPQLKTVIASGYVDDDLALAAAQAGVTQLIYKESDIEEFCAVISKLLAIPSGGA